MGASSCLAETSTSTSASQCNGSNVTVSTGEVCTINAAKSYGIFDCANYFNIAESNVINPLIGNQFYSSKPYSLCSVNSRAAIQNCVLSTSNPWMTLDSDGSFCMLPNTIELPNQFKYKEGSKTIIEKPQNTKIWDDKNKYCEEKWYDWYSIPDYHFGNKYQSSNMKCFKPCNFGSVPDQNIDKCISKSKFDGGKYIDAFPYLPISLVMLLGNNKNTLMQQYDNVLTSNLDLMNIKNVNIYDSLKNDRATQDNIYNDAKADLKTHIENLITLPYDVRHIKVPFFDQSRMKVNPLNVNRIREAYNIASNFHSKCALTSNSTECINLLRDIADISGYEISSSKFNKQLLTFKKASNVAFDGKSNYSKDVILYNIDGGHSFSFNITQDDKLKALSENPVENAGNLNKDTIQLSRSLREDQRRSIALTSNTDTIDLNKHAVDPLKYDETKYVEDEEPASKAIFSIKNIIMTTMFIILLILFGGVLYIIITLLWEPISDMINTIVIVVYYSMFKLKDTLFRGQYNPSSFNKDMTELQKDYLDKKIIKDIKNYKLDPVKLGIS
jgi:hypothetical protein